MFKTKLIHRSRLSTFLKSISALKLIIRALFHYDLQRLENNTKENTEETHNFEAEEKLVFFKIQI